MTQSQQQKALAHALAALSDGSGHDVWGPGVIGHKLWMANERGAAHAFDTTAMVVVRLLGDDCTRKSERPRFIAAMRELAPVILSILESEP